MQAFMPLIRLVAYASHLGFHLIMPSLSNSDQGAMFITPTGILRAL